MERFDELVHGLGASACIGDDCRNAREHVFDAVIKFGGEQISALLTMLASRDITGQALEAETISLRVKFRPRRLLKPYFSAVRPDEAETRRVRRSVGADTTHMRLEVRPIVRVDPGHKITGVGTQPDTEDL